MRPEATPMTQETSTYICIYNNNNNNNNDNNNNNNNVHSNIIIH